MFWQLITRGRTRDVAKSATRKVVAELEITRELRWNRTSPLAPHPLLTGTAEQRPQGLQVVLARPPHDE
jgi:hypothetical protein